MYFSPDGPDLDAPSKRSIGTFFHASTGSTGIPIVCSPILSYHIEFVRIISFLGLTQSKVKVPKLSEFNYQFLLIFIQQQQFMCPMSGDSRASSLSSFSNDTGNNDEQLSVGG